MAFPIKVCAVCEEEFELKPGKPGFANRCPECTEAETSAAAFGGAAAGGAAGGAKRKMDAEERKAEAEANAARRGAIRDLLYRKDS